MKIRTLTKTKDLLAFKTIRIEGALDAPESFRSSPDEMARKTAEDFENQLSGYIKGDFFVGAFIEDSLIGVAALYHEQYEKLAHKGDIGSVYVTPEYRNKGIANQLLTEIIKLAKHAGNIKHINLSVITSNEPAIKLYKGLGFVVYGTEPNIVNLDGKYYDEYLMQLVL